MAILNAPPNATELTVNGKTFAVKNGLVNVPDHLITSSVWEQGYVVHQTAGKVIPEKTASEASKAVKE